MIKKNWAKPWRLALQKALMSKHRKTYILRDINYFVKSKQFCSKLPNNSALALSMEVMVSQFRYPLSFEPTGSQREGEQHVWSQPEYRSCRRRVKFDPEAPKGASLLICLGFILLQGWRVPSTLSPLVASYDTQGVLWVYSTLNPQG